MFSCLGKSFDLPIYAKAMARASPPTRPSCVPCGRNVDPRVVEYFDIDATIDASIPIDCLDPESKSMSGEIFQWRSLMSRPCNDDSMSQSSLLFAYVVPMRLVSFLHSFRFAMRLPKTLPLVFMMVFFSSILNVFFWVEVFCFIALNINEFS